MIRKVRKRREDGEGGEGEALPGDGGAKRRKAAARMCEMNGFTWPANKKFEIERILDRKVEYFTVGKVSLRSYPSAPLAT